MTFFFIQSGWMCGMVIARNEIHAIHISTKTGLHRTGNRLACLPIDERTLNDSFISLLEYGSGRVLMPNLFRRDPILVKAE
jgi:hypothetical protein